MVTNSLILSGKEIENLKAITEERNNPKQCYQDEQ